MCTLYIYIYNTKQIAFATNYQKIYDLCIVCINSKDRENEKERDRERERERRVVH